MPPLNEERAVQAAADLIGELFVFTGTGAAIIFEIQRNSRAEARKEEMRRQELLIFVRSTTNCIDIYTKAMKQKDEALERELDYLKHKAEELERLAKGWGLLGSFLFRNVGACEEGKPKPT